MKLTTNKYNELLQNIGSTLLNTRANAIEAVHKQLLIANWKIGKHIVEFEQHGKEKAVYGSQLLSKLSKDLKSKHGEGFGISNLQYMRLFYIKFPKFQTSLKSSIHQTSGKSKSKTSIHQTSGKLTWSHYAELISVSDDLARSFYQIQCQKENWSVRELKRQIDSALFQRLALSNDKEGVLNLAEKGQEINTTSDAIKDPYIFEFLNLSKNSIIKERGLEKKLIDNLQHFLLELGKGFSFVARQYKITIDNQHLFIDLVFYHRILKCFVLIDLKITKVKHQDIGQMNLYLNYFKEEENTEGDNEPIGIIIAADKQDLLVKYATGGLSNKIFVSKYQLYLPDQKLLEDKIREIINKK
jgi:predicted nuclease of restriction endonuclease-like (RecB) superfamily